MVTAGEVKYGAETPLLVVRSVPITLNDAPGFGTTTGLMNDVTNQVLPNVLGAKLGALADIENEVRSQLRNASINIEF